VESGDVAGRGVVESGDVAGRGVVESGDVAGRGVLESGVVAGRGVLASGGVAERGIAGSGGIAGRGIAEPVGLVAIAESSDEPGMADLFSMWVAPAARGTGAADALIAAALDWARARELTGVLLEVAPGNARAQRVYTRHGFTVTEEPSMIIGGSTMRLRFPVVTSGTGPAPADVHRL
jgi:GNAT superfamily N-acetyltransferase